MVLIQNGINGLGRPVSRKRPTVNNLCRNCLLALRQRGQASLATASAAEEVAATLDTNGHPTSAAASPTPLRTTYQVKASVLLSRPPILTRDLTAFEKSYFLYQRRLNERFALPFTRYFYYQRGTPGDVEWKRKMRERQTPARDIGVYNAYSEEGWNDELLLGARESEPDEQMDAIFRDAEAEMPKGEEGPDTKRQKVLQKPLPRVTEADKTADMKRLDRAMQRSLYLVVRRKGEPRWWFPESLMENRESLHTAAERIIVQTGDVNMNTWVVGNIPLCHYKKVYPQAIEDRETGVQTRGEKIFFMKARILAGQANITNNKFGLEEFQWLAKDEIQKIFHPSDWNAVKNVLVER
ncbi:MAG: hypothetical protein Q9167_000895 [Letrouitia subvulpina]